MIRAKCSPGFFHSQDQTQSQGTASELLCKRLPTANAYKCCFWGILKRCGYVGSRVETGEKLVGRARLELATNGLKASTL
jgi:hypothetical protein